MKKYIAKYKKLFLGIIIGLVLSSTIVYGATIFYASNEVSYDNTTSNLGNGNSTITVQDAIDSLYTKATAIECESGYTKVPSTSNNYNCFIPTPLNNIMAQSAVMDNIASEFVTASTGINFGAVSSSTNGQGVYMRAGTENTTYPIMYYRGAVENNNVLFNNKCWKAVRTTDTGGVKLIYNGENKGTAVMPNCANTGRDTYINISGTLGFAFNTYTSSHPYVGYMYGTVYPYDASNWTSGAKFGSSFTWDGTNYKLVDAETTNPDATHHYSCNSTDADATCTDLRYVYYASGSTKLYITLTGGDGVEEALTKMHTNTNNSNAKTQIDTWYASNMNTVTNKLEDTIWCNDRSIGKANGWSATGSWGTDYKDHSILYGAFERSNHASSVSTVKNRPSLTCANRNDAFTVSNGNGNGKLTYPVALLTEDEMVLAGGLVGSKSQFYLNNGSTSYWSLSPAYSSDSRAYGFYVIDGYIEYGYVYNTYGLRPSVSLKPGTLVIGGDGTTSSPYRIG